MEIIKNYINGELVDAENGQSFDNYNPANGQVYSQIPDSTSDDIQKATDAASAAFPNWSTTSRQERSNLLLKIADLIDANHERLAAAESKDNGKPIKLASRVDIPRASANFRFFASAILHESTEAHQTDQDAINMTLRSPIGVVGCISPWNLPLYLFTWKIAPAIAAGNTVVAKPSEITPMTAFLLSELCIEAGLPAGVLNIVHGTGPNAGQAISEHPDIKAISFTGGTETGKRIAATAAPMFKKLSLELGGKNPNIIFADCDFEEALKTSVHSSFANQGQICLCGSRIFVERSIYDRFKTAFVEKVNRLKVGDPSDQNSNLGAVVSKPHMEKVLSYVELAKQEGGTVLTGGNQVHLEGELAQGYYIAPTVIEGLTYDCQTNQQEIFGPVVTITPFDSEEEVLTMANSTEYGLSATVWTSNLNKANRVSSTLQAGIVWVNCWLLRDLRTPFGGVKKSGVGREGGWDVLNFFTEKKNVCIKL
ncbi:2-hydroxymuconic semialdehyde dehydrogenase [Roseivirga sp. 4D4]|uniref:aldehyde dehydrogenase n=1 Tax=Roseivirga sp. 4D4 TaxID=1889784 RepID=UPI00085298A5|nr:aldehyde dehydrogenase [Roseivirga sp. 4D4]OEK03185.1 2-hydroxymuconic semialdehyde dehydrogenase [Roseivirga sp. 4D4]